MLDTNLKALLMVSAAPIWLPYTANAQQSPQDALDAAMSLWEFQSTGYYDFEYTKHTMMSWMEGYPWTVKVRDGIVSEVLFGNGTAVPLNQPEVLPALATHRRPPPGETLVGPPPSPPARPESNVPPTIDDLFRTIQSAIFQDAHRIGVTYNDTYGFPSDITIDYIAMLADEELYVSVGAFKQQPKYDFEAMQSQLSDARNTWYSLGINMYSFSYDEACFSCFYFNYPWAIQVFFGRAQALDDTGATVEGQDLSTVPHLFDVLQDAIDSGAFDIQVSYHPTLGFPTNIFIDYDPRMADEELHLAVSAMQVRNNPRASMLLAEDLWLSGGISNYTYQYEEFGMLAARMSYPWHVEVVDHEIVSIVDSDQNTVTAIPTLPSIQNIFSVIEGAIDQSADYVDVLYDNTYGVPQSIFIDYSDLVADDELAIQLCQFAATME